MQAERPCHRLEERSMVAQIQIQRPRPPRRPPSLDLRTPTGRRLPY